MPWDSITALGWQQVAIAEDAGGVGAGWSALSMVLIEAGRCLLNAPLLSTIGLAGAFLAAAGTGARPSLSRIASGATATLAFHGPDPNDPDPAAGVLANAGQLKGTKVLVTDAEGAASIIVPVRIDADQHVAVMTVPAHARLEPVTSFDLGRPLSTVQIDADQSAVTLLSADLALGTALARIALAADLLGVARGALDMAVAYAGVREQFGRPIGSFQAIKHRLADGLVAVEKAESLVLAAAGQFDLPDCDERTLHELAEMAKAAAGDAAILATSVNVQIHAAIAMTAEHDAMRYLRRARQGAALLGDVRGCYSFIGERFLTHAEASRS